MKICAKCNGSFEEGIAYCPNDGSRLTTISKLQGAGQAVPEEAIQHAAQMAREQGVEDLTGRTVAGRYQILRRLGEGGMGIVYRAVDTRLEKEVAIKVLKEDFAHRTDVVARFTQEAKSAARIKHENVLDVTDYGQTEDGSFYIAMELLIGTDLADLLQKTGTIEAMRGVNIMIQVTRALGAAHAKGIVHRDLKPENIFLVPGEDQREIVKIVDFGIAQMKDLTGDGNDSSRKLTRTGMIFGTPEYMSPEQAAGKSIDHRVDVYAVGVIMYETLAGRVPFIGDTFMGVLTQHMFENAPPIRTMKPDAEVPPDLEAIIAKALVKDPMHRYQSMQEVGDDLVKLRDGLRPAAAGAFLPSAVKPTATGYGEHTSRLQMLTSDSDLAAGTTGRKRSRLLIVAGLAALVLVAGGATVARALNHSPTTAVPVPPVAPVVPQAPPQPPVAAVPGTAPNPNGAGSGVTNPTVPGPSVVAPTVAVVPSLPPTVTVHVTTTPSGGRVEVEGDASRSCEQAPCDLTLLTGHNARLIARSPGKRGELTVTPDHDGADVTIPMANTGGGNAPHNGNGGTHTGGNGNAHASQRCRPGSLHLDPGTGLMVPCYQAQ